MSDPSATSQSDATPQSDALLVQLMTYNAALAPASPHYRTAREVWVTKDMLVIHDQRLHVQDHAEHLYRVDTTKRYYDAVTGIEHLVAKRFVTE
jgi:hypothetical protein